MRRLAVESDLTDVYDIYMHPAVNPYLGFDPMPVTEFNEQVFRDLLQSQCFFVVVQDAKIIGFLKIVRHPGRVRHVAYIGAFAVHPAFHGTGIAKLLMEDVITELRAQGIQRIELIVESDNPKAIRFYQKLGFVIEGTLQKFLKRADQDHYVDDHIMAKWVD